MSMRTVVVNSPVMATTFNLPTFLLSVLLLIYFATFVVFAILRILTGISVQRVGYLSLRRISFEPRDGIRLEVRKLGLLLHRPTFTHPTWLSIVLKEAKIIIDLRDKNEELDDEVNGGTEGMGRTRGSPKAPSGWRSPRSQDRPEGQQKKKKGNFMELVRKLKDALKKFHRWIKWIQLVDVVFTNSTISVVDVGSLQIGSLTLMVDTRRKSDKNRMFDHCTVLSDKQRPVEWLFSTKSVLFFPSDSNEPIELVDQSTFTIYGVADEGIEGIRDLALAVKVGRISVPCDVIADCMGKLNGLRKSHKRKTSRFKEVVSLSMVMEEMAIPGSRTERMAEAVMESKELLQSFLNGIREIQFAVGYLMVSKSVPKVQPTGKPLQVVLGMKELGMDIHRLNQKSPAHRMYFSSKDIAHQALLAAISISVMVDDGVRQDKLLYVPMVTMTSRTTLLSKTIQIVEQTESNRNANILYANMVVTSPSVDLEPRHLPILVALARSRPRNPPSHSMRRAHLMSRLLPKANVMFSIQEPVVRIVLPPTELEFKGTEDMDMLISSLSSISFDLESSHESDGQNHYSLSSTFRLTSHVLYYRAASGIHHDLLHSDTFDLKMQLNATPEVQVTANAYLSSFSLRLVRPEIVQGLKQMVHQFRRNYRPDKLTHPESSEKQSILRTIPLWLENFKLECNDFSIEVAGTDAEISDYIRGAVVQMDGWTLDYRGRKSELEQRPTPRRRAASRTLSVDESKAASFRNSYSNNPTDGRRLAFHMRGLAGFVLETSESWEQDPFLEIPIFDLVLSTSNDHDGPILHVNSNSKSAFFNYSLYRHYSIIVAEKVLQEAFGGGSKQEETQLDGAVEMLSPDTLDTAKWGNMDMLDSPICIVPEFVNIDVKIAHLKVRATLPSDPPMMLEIHSLDMGQHRWGFPFFKAKHFRLYAESPKVKKCSARLISMRHFRLDLREIRRGTSGRRDGEKSIDLSSDAIRLAIPHQLTLYRVTDNVINAAKACQQMHHRFKTGTNEYILEKKPEGPKNLPRMTLRTKALLFELEDDPFETQLGLIYRIGLSEQKKRLAREVAFDAKVKKMTERDRRKSSETTRTAAGDNLKMRGRSRTWRSDHNLSLRTDSPEIKTRSKSAARSEPHLQMRYDPSSATEPTESAAVSIEDAWERLQEHNSTAWIKRIKWAKDYHRSRMAEARESFWGSDGMPSDGNDDEKILGLPLRPALMAAFFNDVFIGVDKPSFPIEELPKFLHRVGKGLPEDTQFAFLVPVSVKLDFSEARVLLRDYPLPFIHVPSLRQGQSTRLPSWSLQADFVLAEEFRGSESMRHAQVNIIPSSSKPDTPGGAFAIDVHRTVSPVKSYSDIKVSINTSYATRITWCTAYQPAIQDMMMVFETFTKPHVDPSERTGFWDKIRLILHSQITLGWEGDGDVHLTLKGSRDPYKITGDGTGFVMCWRGDVRWEIARDDDPQKFMKVDSEEYLLAIPDFTRQATEEIDIGALPESKSFLSASSIKNGALFKKVIMKLSGRVNWLVGLMFEQELSDEEDWKQRKRSFDFIPHYAVTLKSPQYAKAPPGQVLHLIFLLATQLTSDKVYDAFRGFRSHHLHLSLSIVSPAGRDWSSGNDKPSSSYNTIHLTPRFFTHFYAWWGLFSGAMSLPVRQGELWPGPEKSNKKFGRHLATIKYKLCLSPLFISHIYKHNDKDKLGNDVVAATGLKAKLDTFLLDIHQRREETLPNPKSTTMRINQAELDFHSADIRAVSATIDNVSMEDLINQATSSPDGLSEDYDNDMSQFTIADGDYAWIDMDDFVELDWILPKDRTPKTKIMPLAYTPRFTYFRQTDHPHDSTAQSASPFGHEASHDCIMSQNNDPREIQCALVQARLERVNQQMSKNKEAIETLYHLTQQNPTEALQRESENLIQQSSILFNKLKFLQAMLIKISSKLDDGEKGDDTGTDTDSNAGSDYDSEWLGMESSPFADYASDFDNRFIVHNMQAKWNNSLRNIILNYIHQVSQRRGFVYYMSRRAVKFILDIIEEQKASSGARISTSTDYSTSGTCAADEIYDDDTEVRIQQLLKDGNKDAVAEEKLSNSTYQDSTRRHFAKDDLAGDVAEEYLPQNSYHVRLIAPQIQMQSEKNEGAAVLVAAQGMQLKVVSIMDRERVGDDVSGLVQRRFALSLDNTQFFVSHHQDFVHQSMSLHSANRYGAPVGSSWPPWVPLESMFDFRNNPVGFSRVVERTSATLRYDKHNSLRLKYSDQVSGQDGPASTRTGPLEERRVDYVWVDFPRVEASCDSSQYFAMYIIVLDLLLYSEPLVKLRNEKLEKILLASDFSDLTGTPEMVECLQSRIHQLAEIKQYFEINAKSLDLDGWKGRIAVDQDLATCEEELFFMMKAITTAQRKYDDRSSRSGGVVRWFLTASEIVWHLLRENLEALVDISLKKAAYERMDNADGSNANTVEVEMLKGYNLLPDAVYPEMIAPYFDEQRNAPDLQHHKMLRVKWNMLEAIAGIPIMDHFEVNLFPMKIQLERDIGDRIFEYIFPGVPLGKSTFENGNFSPFMVHSMKPLPDEAGYMEREMETAKITPQSPLDDSSSEKSDVSGGLELHLRPTMSLSADHRPLAKPTDMDKPAARPKTSSAASLFSKSRATTPSLSKQSTDDSFVHLTRRSTDGGPAPSVYASDRGKKVPLFSRNNNGRNQTPSDELSQMMARASNYMTLSYIKIPSVALCLSYKGRGESNFEDIHEFMFRMPTLEYRNKTWSNLDLAMHLKKDIIRALISHTGAILQNKLTQHRPGRPQSKLLRVANLNGSRNTSSASSIRSFQGPVFESSRGSFESSRTGGRVTPSIIREDSGSTISSSNHSSADSRSGTERPTADEKPGSIFHNTLGRHLTNLAATTRHKEGTSDDTDESIKKKSRLLLGKKVFGGL